MTRAPPAAPTRCTITISVPSLVFPAPGIHRPPLARSHARPLARPLARSHARSHARTPARPLDRSSLPRPFERPRPSHSASQHSSSSNVRTTASCRHARSTRDRLSIDRSIDARGTIDRSIDVFSPTRRARRASLGVRWGRARERRDDAEARRRRASRRAMAVVMPWTRTRGVGPRNASRRARTTCVRARR